MPIRWDSLLVRHLVRELDDRLRGARLRALRLDGGHRDLLLLFREETLVWRLHPSRGYLRFYPPQDPGAGDIPLSSRVRGVSAPPDERVLTLALQPVRGRRGGLALVVELLGNQWNAVVTEGPDHRIRHVLHRRTGARDLTVGAAWAPPPPSRRSGTEAPPGEGLWDDIAAVEEGEARRRLVASVAWTSPVNAGYVLGDGVGERTAEGMRTRWEALAGDNGTHPVVLRLARGGQPYPVDLPGTPSEACTSLVAALDRCATDAEESGAGPSLLPTELHRDLERAVERAERRTTSLEAQLQDLGDESHARALGDLILARYHLVPAGASEVLLDDFDGNPVRVPLDPALSVQDNAARHYDEAARIERARERLPGLIRSSRKRVGELRALLERVQDGEADAGEVGAALPERARRSSGSGPSGGGPSLPYHVFRSSGGLEIRVGRGAKHNDDLTFRHSAPNDVWLHARHTAGAHVILRWNDPETPPARDLTEAAILAALHSKARTSGTVPVDWTLRKYVRKPRGAAPGSVIPQRVKTVFVAPDEDAVQRLDPGEE